MIGHGAAESGTAVTGRRDVAGRGRLAYAAAAVATWALLQGLWLGFIPGAGAGLSAFGPDDYMRLVQVSEIA